MQVTDGVDSSELPQTPWRLHWSLTTGTLAPHILWHSKKFRIKYVLRSLVMPFSTYFILKSLTDHPCYKTLLMAQPRLPCRLHRPYLSSRLKRGEGARAISYHYRTLYNLLEKDTFKSHLNGDLVIASISGKGDTEYRIHFLSTYALDREGESTLMLKGPGEEILCKLTFTLYEITGERYLIVGGLQGLKHKNAHEIIHTATKDLFGIFPKKVVYEALIAVAGKLQVKKIKSVSNKTHVYQALRYNDKKQYLHADYNSSWEIMGGIINADGYYDLPTDSSRKDINEIPSKKRSEYRKRYELLDKLKGSIGEIL